MSKRRVLVVGTTPDYIAAILSRHPGRALFLTDQALRFGSTEIVPRAEDELLCALDDTNTVLVALASHLRRFATELSGITCFDCEHMSLTATIARMYDLPYPTGDAVRLSRSKFLSKEAWLQAGVDCPRNALIRSEKEARDIVDQLGGPVVIKPLTGSGSELTFYCSDGHEAAQAFHTFRLGLKKRSSSAMYRTDVTSGDFLDPSLVCIAEEYAVGREYSCDFVIDGDTTRIIRVARKIPHAGKTFGTAWAYVVPGRLPGWLTEESLIERLRAAALALGINRAICMADFMVNHDNVRFIEMTPRPGGDCLPPLIRQASGLDMLKLALDFAEGAPVELPAKDQWTRLAGVRLFADRGGIIRRMSSQAVESDPRVREVYLKRSTGHRVVLPPDDYDSWLLGHVIFQPEPDREIDVQAREITALFVCDIEPYVERKASGYDFRGGPNPRSLSA